VLDAINDFYDKCGYPYSGFLKQQKSWDNFSKYTRQVSARIPSFNPPNRSKQCEPAHFTRKLLSEKVWDNSVVIVKLLGFRPSLTKSFVVKKSEGDKMSSYVTGKIVGENKKVKQMALLMGGTYPNVGFMYMYICQILI